MADQESMRLFHFTVAISVILIWYFSFYLRTRADRLREDLFTIRDDLFDYMWENHISYDLAAYVHMRDSLNGAIRVAEQLNLRMLLFAHIILRRYRAEFRKNITSTVWNSIEIIENVDTRMHFESLYDEINSRIKKYIFMEGIHYPVFKLIRFGNFLVDNLTEELSILGQRGSKAANIINNVSKSFVQ